MGLDLSPLADVTGANGLDGARLLQLVLVAVLLARGFVRLGRPGS